MYRHILIPTDGSELAQHGVAHGLALAKSVGAKVFVINVVEPLFAVTGDFASVLDRVADEAREVGVSCETIQVENVPPHQAILAAAEDKGLQSHCYVIAWVQRIFRASARQCDKQGPDPREDPRIGLSVNAPGRSWRRPSINPSTPTSRPWSYMMAVARVYRLPPIALRCAGSRPCGCRAKLLLGKTKLRSHFNPQ